MVKFGIISDTFIRLSDKPKYVSNLIEQIKEIFKNVDEIIHGGNIIDQFFLQELEKIAPVRCVKGDMDIIDGLNEYLIIKGGVYNIGVIHNKPEKLEEFFQKQNLHILIYGNTCQPLIQGTPYNTLIINPGSPTRPQPPLPKRGFEKPIARPSVITLKIDADNILSTYIINLKNK
jgi:putative phosphoesterase